MQIMKTDYEKGCKELERNAVAFNYRRTYFAADWEIQLPIPARKLFQAAAGLARAEGNINHAISLEARLPQLPKGSVYRVGRLKNGIATACVEIN